MNRVATKTLLPGEIDALLSAFFQSEKPAPWPAFQAPKARTLPLHQAHRRHWSALTSRFVLAASIALLLLGSWLLPAPLTAPPKDRSGPIPTLGDGTAMPRGVLPGPSTPDRGKLTPESPENK